MSNAVSETSFFKKFRLNRSLAFLLAATLLIQIGGVFLATRFPGTGVEAPSTSQSADPGVLLDLLIPLLIGSFALAGGWKLSSRLGPPWSYVIGFVGGSILLAPVGYLILSSNLVVPLVTILVVGIAVTAIFEYLGVMWVLFNLIGIGLGMGVAYSLGHLVTPGMAIVILVLTLIWDFIAVKKSAVMYSLVQASATLAIPNYLVIPDGKNIQMEETMDWLSGKQETRPQNLGGIIGLGDFVIPALLPVSTALALSGGLSGVPIPAVTAIIGTCLATVALNIAMFNSETGLPALPWLNTGAILGFLVGIPLTATSFTAVLGI